MSRKFSDDWVSHNVPHWEQLLAPLAGKPGLTFLEVGSHEGRSACWWLDHILTDPTSRLICVDPWGYAPDREATFDANVGDHANKVRKFKAESRVALPTLARGSLDFCYVDGDHEAASALTDALLVLPLMKRGGLVLFDDYEWAMKGDVHHLPREGIDAFLRLNDWRVEEVHRGYQLAVRVK